MTNWSMPQGVESFNLTRFFKGKLQMMNRFFLTAAAFAILIANGCGSKEDGVEKTNSGTSTNGTESEIADSNAKAQVGFKFDAKSAMEIPFVKSAIAEQKDAPSWVKSMQNVQGFVSLPDEFQDGDMTGMNFSIQMDFASEADAQAAFADMDKEKKLSDVAVDGKSYKVRQEPNAPKIYANCEGKSLKMRTEGYVRGSDFASANLSRIMQELPSSDCLHVGVDVAGAKAFLEGASATAANDAQAAQMMDTLMMMKGITISGGMEKDLFTLSLDAENEDGAKKAKGMLRNAGVLAGTVGFFLDENETPSIFEMYSHVVACLAPKTEGTKTKIVVTKPENFDELTTKMSEEFPKLQKKLGGAIPPSMMGTPGPGGSQRPRR